MRLLHGSKIILYGRRAGYVVVWSVVDQAAIKAQL
jgi:predicted ester cyclase